MSHPSNTILSQTAQQILHNMDYLLDDHDYNDDNDDDNNDNDNDHDPINLITPPRFRQRKTKQIHHNNHDQHFSSPSSRDDSYSLLDTSMDDDPNNSNQKKTSPGLSTATSPTRTTMTDKTSKDDTIRTTATATEIYTCPERQGHSQSDNLGDRHTTNNNNNNNTNSNNNSSHPSTSNANNNSNSNATLNPSGMVIHTQYAKEAILDPTWLDSDDEEEESDCHDKEEQESQQEEMNSIIDIDTARSASSNSRSRSIGKTWSVGTGTGTGTGSICSLSVGSCGLGLGKMSLTSDGSVISLSGSEGSGVSLGMSVGVGLGKKWGGHSHLPSGRFNRVMLNHIDVVDMGVESVGSGSSSDYDHVLDYLYDLDRRDYDLSEDDDTDDEKDDDDGEHDDSIVDGTVAADDDYADGYDDDYADNDDDNDDENSDGKSDGAYLPPHLMSPPRLSRKVVNHDDEEGDSDISVDSSIASQENISFKESMEPQQAQGKVEMMPEVMEIEQPETPRKPLACNQEEGGTTVVSPVSSLSTIATATTTTSTTIEYDSDSASGSERTNVCSNCSPSAFAALLDEPAGIIRGDLIFSILDCPGSRTRKKRFAKKHEKEGYQWGAHAAKGAIACMRLLRKDNNSQVLVDQDQVNQSSISPERSGRILGKESVDDDEKCDNCQSPGSRSLISGTFSADSVAKSPHRSQRLEHLALDYLRNDDHDNALSAYFRMQTIHEEYLNCCEEGTSNRQEQESYMGTILVNIGIIYLCKGKYSQALECFRRAEQKCAIVVDCRQVGQVDVNILKANACYALGQFGDALKLWKKSICLIRKSKVQDNQVMAELLNNLGCVYFEIGTEIKALKYFKESMQIQKKALFDNVYGGNDSLQQHHLHRLASTRANIGYIYMRMKKTDRAIEYFDVSLLDQNLCLDAHHPLVMSTMENLAIAYMRKGNKDSAIQTYSKMLTAQIETLGAAHHECVATLTKLTLLQLKGREKAGKNSCVRKIQDCLRKNDPCQKERFEKLLKVCKVSGLKTITVIGKRK